MELKKCLVLDLDNTLWGGVAGEDGVEGIQISIEAPGNAYLAFQQAVLDLYNRGVILAINSRNNPDDALAVIRTHPNMLLKETYFAAVRMNWLDKAENLRSLAAELNIGLDSMVFLDDDPANRAAARALAPEVETPELPQDPAEYARFLNALPYFPNAAMTDEDQMRGNLYVTERIRRSEEERHATKESFLSDLGLSLVISKNDDRALTRLSQMTGKTNQFNIRKQPLAEDELQALMQGSSTDVYHARLSDRFGDYGIIAVAVVEKGTATWHISSLLMSCRALARGAEEAFVSIILEEARQAGAKEVSIAFEQSEKNAPARTFIETHFPGGSRDVDTALSSPQWVAIRYENL